MANTSNQISVFERMTIVMAADLKSPEFGSVLAVEKSPSCLGVEFAVKWQALYFAPESSAARLKSSALEPRLLIAKLLTS